MSEVITLLVWTVCAALFGWWALLVIPAIEIARGVGIVWYYGYLVRRAARQSVHQLTVRS